MDVVNIKISKFGGLTKARQARDLCASLGIAMTIEDSWGSDITTAAIAHLAHSTPTELLFTSTDFNSYVTVSTAEGAPQRVDGRMSASLAPGLGIEPRMDVLGEAEGRGRMTMPRVSREPQPMAWPIRIIAFVMAALPSALICCPGEGGAPPG